MFALKTSQGRDYSQKLMILWTYNARKHCFEYFTESYEREFSL